MLRTAALLAFVAVTTARQIESGNPAFQASGGHGCIGAPSNFDGVPAIIQGCFPSIEQSWTSTTVGLSGASRIQQLKIFGESKCLDVPNGLNADGTKLQIWTCAAGNPNQLWTPNADGTLQWVGTNKCIDLTDGNTSDGNHLQIWTCNSNNLNQRWIGADSRIYSNVLPPRGPVKVIAASSDTNGAAVLLDDYDARSNALPQGNRFWSIPPVGTVGQIKTFYGTKCLDVPNGNATNGNPLQVWTCSEGNVNQLWSIESLGEERKYFVRWAVPVAGGRVRMCMQVKDLNVQNPGGQVAIFACDSTEKFQWWYESE